jgi:hypothetical protein
MVSLRDKCHWNIDQNSLLPSNLLVFEGCTTSTVALVHSKSPTTHHALLYFAGDEPPTLDVISDKKQPAVTHATISATGGIRSVSLVGQFSTKPTWLDRLANMVLEHGWWLSSEDLVVGLGPAREPRAASRVLVGYPPVWTFHCRFAVPYSHGANRLTTPAEECEQRPRCYSYKYFTSTLQQLGRGTPCSTRHVGSGVPTRSPLSALVRLNQTKVYLVYSPILL